jgi:hypothetical protein
MYDPYGILQQQAQYGMLPETNDELDPMADPFAPRKPQISDLMPEEEKSSMLRTLANVGASGMSGVGWLLDTPGSVIRGGLSGGPMKALSALWENSEDRVDGRELLRQYNMIGDENNWGNFAGGLAAEILLDPFTYGTLGLAGLGKGALSQTGKAMKAAGLLRDAALDSVTRVNPLRTAAGLAPYVDDIPTPRVREFLRRETPTSALNNIADPVERAAARTRLQAQMNRFGVDPTVMDRPAAVFDNFRIPGTNIGFEVNGGRIGDAFAQGLDRLGDFTKRAPGIGTVTRTAAALFDPAVNDLGTVSNDLNLTNELQLERRFANREARDRLANVRGNYTRLQQDAMNAQVPDTIPSGPLAGQAIPTDLRGFENQRLWNALGDYVESRPIQGPALPGQTLGKTSGDELADWVMENVPEFRAVRDHFVSVGPSARAAAADSGLRAPLLSSSGVDGLAPRQLRWWDNPAAPQIPGGAPYVDKPWARDQRAFGVLDNFGRSRDEAYDINGGMRAFRYLTGGQGGSVVVNGVNVPLIDAADLQRRLIGADDAQAQVILNQAFNDLGRVDPTQFTRGGSALPYDHLFTDLRNSAAYRAASPAAQAQMMADLTTRVDGNYKRLANLLRTADTQFAKNGVGIFDTPSWNNFLRYEQGQAVNQANANRLFQTLLRNHDATPAPAVVGGVNVPLVDAAEQLGFDKTNFINRWLREGLGDPNQLSLSQRHLQALRTLTPQTQLAPPENAILNAIDQFTNAFKVGALASPAFHTRNAYSGALNSATQGAFNPLDMLAAWRASQGNPEALGRRLRNTPGFSTLANDTERARKFLQLTGQERIATGNVLSDISTRADPQSIRGLYTGSSNEPTVARAARELLLGRPGRKWGQFGNDFFSMRGVGLLRAAPSRNTNPLLVLNDAVGQGVEDSLRTGTFLNQVRKGVDPGEAGDITRLLQLDYTPEAYTSFERKWLKRLIPFYGFQKQIEASVADNLLYRPGGLQGQSVRAVNAGSRPSEDNFIPDYLRQSAAIPLPESLGGVPAEGLRRYLTNLDLPWESTFQQFIPGIGSTFAARLADTISKTGSNLLGQTNPLIKAPIEQITNRQLYSGRNLSDLYSVLENDIGPMGRPAEQFISNFVPFGARGLGVYRQLTDDRLSGNEAAAKAAFNLLAGVKITDVDAERSKRLAAREVLNQMLETTPGVRTYENVNVPEDALRAMPEEQRRMYLLYKIIQNEAAKRARDKRKAETAIDPLQLLGVTQQF